MRGHTYQILLILASAVCLILLALFFYREIAPEYLMYQDRYLALEKFRSTLTGLPPPPFQKGIKQIVLESDTGGNPVIDRCTSCHVALEIPYFSPTRLARDLHGQIRLDANGWPIQEKNPDYIWGLLDERIAELTDPLTEQTLLEQGREGEILQRRQEAQRLEDLKIAQVGGHTFDVSGALRMHPLMGRETRPFEFHPVYEYGCTVCHNGNGRGLTTVKAHGPVLDGQYDAADMGPKKVFLERDEENDPRFARMFNDKPSHSLLFQTTPLFLDGLIEAKCVQCHQVSDIGISLEHLIEQQLQDKRDSIQQSLRQDEEALFSLTQLFFSVENSDSETALRLLGDQEKDSALPLSERQKIASQISYLTQFGKEKILPDLQGLIGDYPLVRLWIDQAEKLFAPSEPEKMFHVEQLPNLWKMFHVEHFADPRATGLLFAKERLLQEQEALLQHAQEAQEPKPISQMERDVSLLTGHFQRGQSLYFSQACYVCHRISGLARGGIGPELTQAGELYPWFLKESIVWPQADLPTSTMPNMVLDHTEVEELMAFLLAQRGDRPAVAEAAYKKSLQAWEAGAKLPWEKPIPPAKMRDVRYAMTVFAVEGCAACHRLKGYQSDAGFALEKTDPEKAAAESRWFQKLIPEEIAGSHLVEILQSQAEEIDQRIVDGVRSGSLLEELEKNHPGLLLSFNAPFQFALRSQNAAIERGIRSASGDQERKEWEEKRDAWHARVLRVYMIYLQEYGLGRLIAPRPNWSGVYHTDQWLMEHFRNPTALVPRSIMPIFPFDDTKFYSLTHMLNVLGIQNRDAVRHLWRDRGFDPARAYEILCSQCHGPFLQGNGPVAEWIYPVPKNLRNAEFLRHLTRENAIRSIRAGVPGTPMPPWGTAAADKPDLHNIPVLTEPEIEALVDWIFSTLPGSRIIRGQEDVPKWQYDPEDILRELEKEGFPLDLKREEQALQWTPAYFAGPPSVASPGVETLFDVREETLPDGETERQYFIKKKFYTPGNLEEGRQFFRIHCASCHGNEGDGSGERSGTMLDAKPRMLTNLEWSHERDDLRLLRSIKFGVPGTSMVAWGDQTSALKRLQLVMYIRSLSQEQKQRREASSEIYQAFDVPLLQIGHLRSENQNRSLPLQNQFDDALVVQQQLFARARRGEVSVQEIAQASEKAASLQKQLLPYEEREANLQQLQQLVQKEKEIYSQIAASLLRPDLPPHLHALLLSLLQAKKEGFPVSRQEMEKIEELQKRILLVLKQVVDKTEEEKRRVEGKIASPQKLAEEREIEQQLSLYNSLVEQIREAFRQDNDIQKQQKDLIDAINQKEIS